MANRSEKGRITLLSLSIPIVIEQVLRSLMGTINTFMLSRVSDDASAAAGVANQALNVVIMAATMLASGTAVVINQCLGAGETKRAARLTMNSLTVSAAVGAVPSLAALLVSTPFMELVGLEAKLVPDAAAYLRIAGSACLFQFVSSMIAAHLRCRGKAQLAMISVVCNNAVNLAGSLLVVEGLLPLAGVPGIAAVRLFSEALGLLLIAVFLFCGGWGLQARDLVRIRMRDVRQIVKLGFQSGLEGISYTTAQLVTTSFLTSLPAAVLSAKVYTQTVNNYAYLAGQAVGQAAQILSGQLIGAGKQEEAYRFVRRSWRLVCGCNLLFSALFFLFSGPLIGLFTDSQEIQAIARTLFLIDIFTCVGRSFNHSFNYGLRSAGYVFWPMIFANCSVWLINAGLGYVFAFPLGLGIVGVWLAQMTDEWVRGLGTAWLWLRKKWIHTAVLQND